MPHSVWLDSFDAALHFNGKYKEAQRFVQLVELTAQRQATLLQWLENHPLQALELVDDWPRLLDVVAWLQAHPRPGVYLRQVDVAGVDSKFIESNKAVLGQLLDLALPAQAIDQAAVGAAQFCHRYGFLEKPLRVRFRWNGCDLGVTQRVFASLDPSVKKVFITENEINFLSLPVPDDCMVIFGAGYGFDAIASAHWLHRSELHYWGDIDTHGFAILNQLRSHFPHAQSLLMDEATLHAHSTHWAREPKPELRDLLRLTPAELAVFNALRDQRFGKNLRLEQERIGFNWVKAALAQIGALQ